MTHYMDNQRKPMSKRDKQVELRNEVLMIVDRGCEYLNNGDRSILSSYLKCLHNEIEGFVVDTKPEGKYEFFNVDYTAQDGIILIKEVESDNELIMVLKLKDGQCKGEWRAYELNPDYFRYDADLDAEAQWEREAESAYERYYDAKTMYDDPRGY